MQRSNPPFRADQVGSLLRSSALKDARAKRERGEITVEQLKAIEDREIEALIKKQEAVGLKSITDGENRRKSWQTDFIAALPGIKTVLGLVTSKSGKLESKDELKRRIEQASKFIALDQLCLSPQCGFASTEEGNVLAEDEQWAKLRMIVDVADEVWGK